MINFVTHFYFKIKNMNQAHLHMVVNHFPIIGIIIGVIVLGVGILSKSEISKRIGGLILIGSSLFTFPSFETGEGAEEIVEHIQGVSEDLIEKHEELAEQFMGFVWAIILIGVFTLLSEWKMKKFTNLLYISLFVVSIFATYFAKQVGTSGGEIRHTEIRNKNISTKQETLSDKEVKEHEED
jgi:uncharacterized membrane protein